MMTDEEIAKGLTGIERDWLLRPQDRAHTDITYAARALEQKGLARPVFSHATRDFGHVATLKGLRVRAILEKEQSNG